MKTLITMTDLQGKLLTETVQINWKTNVMNRVLLIFVRTFFLSHKKSLFSYIAEEKDGIFKTWCSFTIKPYLPPFHFQRLPVSCAYSLELLEMVWFFFVKYFKSIFGYILQAKDKLFMLIFSCYFNYYFGLLPDTRNCSWR